MKAAFRILALVLFLVGSALFWYAIYERHAHPQSQDQSISTESTAMLIVGAAALLGLAAKSRSGAAR